MPPKKSSVTSRNAVGRASKSARTKRNEPPSPDMHATVPCIPPLATVPAEVLDEIFDYFLTFPPMSTSMPASMCNWSKPPNLQYSERTVALRAVSQTCRALRRVILPRLWSRIDACWVPEDERGHWYKYVMQELKRRARGVSAADPALRAQVRTLTFVLTRSDMETALPALRKLLKALPALHTIEVFNCKITRELARSLGQLTLPNVRVLSIPDGAAPLVRACPNVTHVRCLGGRGANIINALEHCQCEMFDGMVSWSAANMNALLAKAPGLHTLEFLPDWYRHEAMADVLRLAVGFKALRVLIITFSWIEEQAADLPFVQVARDVLTQSSALGVKRLVVRRPAVEHKSPDWDDFEEYMSSIEIV